MIAKSLFTLLFVFFSLAADCPFCDLEIIHEQEIYRLNHWRILIDYKPVLSGHLLLVPIEHRLTRHELTKEEHDELYDIEKIVRCVFLARFGKDVEDFQYEKNGPTLQSVHHFHIHVLPFADEMHSFWERMRLFSRLFLFPPTPLSDEEFSAEKTSMQHFLKNCVP